MTRTLLASAVLLLTLCLVPVASAAWVGDDPHGDATNPLANSWADLVHGTLDQDRATLAVASSVRMVGTAFVALYEAEGELRYCAAMEDRVLLGFTGRWDAEALAPADGKEADATFVAGSPAAYEIVGCRGATNATNASFLSLDAKPAPLGQRGILLDEMRATRTEPDDGVASPVEDVVAPAQPISEAGEVAPGSATVPLGAAGLAAIPLAALAGALLGAPRSRGRA